MGKKRPSVYEQIIVEVFRSRHEPGGATVPFTRDDLAGAARKLNVRLPKNLGDLLYSFRFRAELPLPLAELAPPGKSWMIRLMGHGQYAFVASALTRIIPRPDLAATKIPDATPGIIEKYALSDEQALLAKLRYNRLVDVFTGITCYSLQSHLRTAVTGLGQVETDEMYVGLDRRGVHYVLPIQAKGGRDQQSVVQVEQDMAICREKFPLLVCRPLAAQFMPDGVIAMLELEEQGAEIVISEERHYRLVPPEELTDQELREYQRRTPGA